MIRYDVMLYMVRYDIWYNVILYDMMMYDTQYGTYYIKPTMSKQ